jgi:putative PEP-CTERM system TPR-repeat lipoprotein
VRQVNWLLLVLFVALAGCDKVTPEQHLNRATQYSASGELTSAVIELKNALQKEPLFGAARLELGRLYLVTGDYPAAVKELERALDLGQDPDSVRPYLLQAKMFIGRYNEVLGALDEAGELSPTLMAIKGQALVLAKDSDGARELFRQALAQDNSLAEAYIGLAQLALQDDNTAEATRILTDGVAAVTNNRRLWLAKADSDLRAGHRDAARDAYRAASRVPGGGFAPDIGLVRVAVLGENYKDASEILDELARKAPRDPNVNYFRALVAFQTNDFAGAENALDQVLARVPNHLPAMLLMGAVAYKQGRYPVAESNLSRYVARAPGDVGGRQMLAATRLATGDASGAIEALAPAKGEIQSAEGFALLGNAYLQTGNFSAATEYLGKAAQLQPDQAELHTQLGLSLLGSGDNAKGIAELETAVALTPDVLQTEVTLIQARLRTGDLAGASEAAEVLARKEPNSPIAHNLVGITSLAKGDEGAAVKAFNRALALDAGFAPAAINLARLASKNGDLEQARTRYLSVLKTTPENLTALLGLAQISSDLGANGEAWKYLEQARASHEDALAPRLAMAALALRENRAADADLAVREALALAPEDPTVLLTAAQVTLAEGDASGALPSVGRLEALSRSEDLDTRTLLGLAEVQRLMGRFDPAQTTLERVLGREPQSPEARSDMVRVAVAANEPARARENLDQLAKIDPKRASALEADVQLLEGRTEDAIAGYRAALEKGDNTAAVRLAGALYEQGGAAPSIEFMESWLKVHPDDLAIRKRAAALEGAHGNREGAIRNYQYLLEAEPDNWAVLNNLAVLYGEQKDPRAIALARQAYDLSRKNPEAADTLGWLLVQFDDDGAEALALLQTAAANLAENPTVWYHLATAKERAGSFDEALAAVGKALSQGEFPERGDAEALSVRLKARGQDSPS